MRRRLAGLTLGLVGACAAWSASAAAESGSAQLTAFLRDVRTLEAHFEQSLYDETGRLTDQQSGEVYLQRPGRFRWSYGGEFGQDLIADGENLYIHDRGLEQVTERELGRALGDSPALLLTTDRPLDEQFVIEDRGEQAGVSWVSLRPRAAESVFQTVRIGFEEGRLRFMELVDNFGNLTQLRFSDLQVNVDLDPALFRFEPPAGTDVIRDD